MQGRFAWLLAGIGAAVAAAGFLRGRRGPRPAEPFPEPEVGPEPEPDVRADELRRRIEEARDLESEREAFEEAETPVDLADPGDPEARRHEVHERGRALLERMRNEQPPE
jgi:hypothetical protein